MTQSLVLLSSQIALRAPKGRLSTSTLTTGKAVQTSRPVGPFFESSLRSGLWCDLDSHRIGSRGLPPAVPFRVFGAFKELEEYEVRFNESRGHINGSVVFRRYGFLA